MNVLSIIFLLPKILNRLFYCFILFFFVAFNFSHNSSIGWFPQSLPDLNGATIVEMVFTDSLTGYSVTSIGPNSQSYILKTTNGGDNWNIILTDSNNRSFSGIEFANSSVGYASTFYNTGGSNLYKTTNKGVDWIKLNTPGMFQEFSNISVVSEEEIWYADIGIFNGGIFRSTNGGVNWELKYPPNISGNPNRIYMVNSRMGFLSNGNNKNSYLIRTTNAGETWAEIPNAFGWEDIYFIDSLNGWKSESFDLEKTTNGGLNWSKILVSRATGNLRLGAIQFSAVNVDSIWVVGSYYLFPNFSYKGIILFTADGGKSWGYQLPDTNINIPDYDIINFTDKNNGWTYKSALNSGVHTTTGGDSISYVNVRESSSYLTDDFNLKQNYPNPFNPKTVISYNLRKGGFVSIRIYNIQGKLLNTLVRQNQMEGTYDISFNGQNLPSGVYFYSLNIDERVKDTKKMILNK